MEGGEDPSSLGRRKQTQWAELPGPGGQVSRDPSKAPHIAGSCLFLPRESPTPALPSDGRGDQSPDEASCSYACPSGIRARGDWGSASPRPPAPPPPPRVCLEPTVLCKTCAACCSVAIETGEPLGFAALAVRLLLPLGSSGWAPAGQGSECPLSPATGRAALLPPCGSHCQEALLMTPRSDQRGRATRSRPHSWVESGSTADPTGWPGSPKAMMRGPPRGGGLPAAQGFPRCWCLG